MKNKQTNAQLSVMHLLAMGKFSEIERLCINNSQLRAILLQWKGIRHTAFFKKRLKFYKHFAKQTGLRNFTPEVKNQMRDEFAKRHCIKQAVVEMMDSFDVATFTTQISRIRFNRDLIKRRRRQKRLGL